ncbi:hypothetical protein THIOM_005582 [Candidatus Thiomargarita nelsonii]|uniref:Nucleotide exchange factor GrpE n=1 Tax=Candidatus Thiomargarita nelsonii TaxID=1003181 RepID=A0A176RSU8_9GAMM|nr:hypothetical protein THIOM_005582 [Candidatus Thiomargarita nelsonii]
MDNKQQSSDNQQARQEKEQGLDSNSESKNQAQNATPVQATQGDNDSSEQPILQAETHDPNKNRDNGFQEQKKSAESNAPPQTTEEQTSDVTTPAQVLSQNSVGEVTREGSTDILKLSQQLSTLQYEKEQLEKKLAESERENKRLKEIEKKYNDIKRENEFEPQSDDPNLIPRWWNRLYQSLIAQFQQTGKATYDPDEYKTIRRYPDGIIKLLYKLNKSIEDEKSGLLKWLSGKNDEIYRLNKTKTLLKKNVTTLQSEIKKLQSSNAELQLRVESLQEMEANYKSLQERNNELNARCTRLVREITTLKTGEANTPQHQLLFKDFKELKDQDFKSISNKIFSLFHKCQPGAQQANRKSEIAKIRYELSKAILLKGLEISIKNENITDGDIKNITDSLKKEILDRYCGGTENLAGVSEKFEELSKNIASLVEKGLKLVDEINHATPQGELLWFEKEENVPFDPKKHEVSPSCEETGLIELTLHPGYMVRYPDTGNERVFEKALVLTRSD